MGMRIAIAGGLLLGLGALTIAAAEPPPRPLSPRPVLPPPVPAAEAPAPDAALAAETGEAKTSEAKAAEPTSTVDPDIVILRNQQRFSGTVLSNQSDPDVVAINTGTGILRLRRDIIASVHLGLTARIGQVKTDDAEGLVTLAAECRSRRRNREALDLLKRAVALPTCELRARGLYAELIDELEGPETALPLYLAYRAAGGDDPAILGRLKELETARQLWEQEMRNQGLDPVATAATGQPTPSATATPIDEGLEKFGWMGDDRWANPVKTTQISLVTTEGVRKVLQVDYDGHPEKSFDKAAVVLRRPLQLKGGAKLGFLLCNRAGKEIALAIALKAGPNWTYFESPPQRVQAAGQAEEFVSVSFDLGAANFKSEASGWAYNARLEHIDNVRELQVLIMNGKSKGQILLAGIGLDAPEY
jgi:hypothetical protein